jgi:Holliday junction resolvase
LAKQKETIFKERVLRELKKLPRAWVCKTQQVSKRGTPDILACINGRFCAIELKTETGKLSALQDYNLQAIAKSGGIAIVMTPNNFEEEMTGLREMQPIKE